MMKLVYFLVVASFACKLILGRWPWDFLRPKSTRKQALFRARKLLGVEAGATRQDIIEAHRRLVVMVHPDKGGTNSQVHEANSARDLLLDELPYES
jgi:DnaJ homolog subfamily C member 19